MASLMQSRILGRVAGRPAAAFRAVAPRATVSIVSRPSSTPSSFLGGSFCSSVVERAPSNRGSLLVLAAGGKSMGCTKGGTRRKRRRTSGFRTRKLTKSGRNVLKARRKKGRHSLAPASERASAGKKH
ncbi:hypothetical protein CEUSTIGMA_g300.t1 [Chlamydomonas eustigma]|uniref:50S ribosomal protein L34, chloroplastic n=1 Tax=Chlamydomonas eustigma TaxID=1157962 RepID=A0A250WPR8_9CHLO|nr:hypothetical protein CEUSTIGMA_g300.t1 [Chlamydomonas eustigma]|eukprot:GAX72845.1 hypothetical protein CEUSTIGMA_g300.t1 [Chlamydomonas eustigma]